MKDIPISNTISGLDSSDSEDKDYVLQDRIQAEQATEQSNVYQEDSISLYNL